MKSFLDCLGLKTGFSWIYGHIAEKQVQFHGQKRFNKLWFNIQRFKRTQSVKFRIPQQEMIPLQEMKHRYFLLTDTNGVLLPL